MKKFIIAIIYTMLSLSNVFTSEGRNILDFLSSILGA